METETVIDPIPIDDAVESYIENRYDDDAWKLEINAHRSQLAPFRRWAKTSEEIADTTDLTGHRLAEYSTWRRDAGDISKVDHYLEMIHVRRFIQYLSDVNAVDTELPDEVPIPNFASDRKIHMGDSELDVGGLQLIIERDNPATYIAEAILMYDLADEGSETP